MLKEGIGPPLATHICRVSGYCVILLLTNLSQVHPAAKLPAWYLLDMVCKNIPDPYSRLFSAWIVQVFLESYRDVDQATRSRMEELVLTWRNGSASRKELFGVAAQVSIERGIWGDGASGSTVRLFLLNFLPIY